MGFDPQRAALASDYMRIAAITLWAFEVLQTLPAEWRIYRRQMNRTRPGPAVGYKLFIAVRYLGTAAMITSAVGFFGRGYSAEFCVGYQRVAPLFKVFSALANQAVFLWRTYAISGKRRWVLQVIGTAYVCTLALQFFANSTTVPASSAFGNCLAGPKPGFRVSWVFYLAAMLYDFLVIAISWYYLVGSRGLSWGDMYGFTRALLTEGVAYVMLATVMNVINLTFFELPVATTVQGMFATMGIAVTSLASQRILLHILDPANRTNYTHSNLGIETTQGGIPQFHHPRHGGGSGTDDIAAIRTIGGGLMPGVTMSRKGRSDTFTSSSGGSKATVSGTTPMSGTQLSAVDVNAMGRARSGSVDSMTKSIRTSSSMSSTQSHTRSESRSRAQSLSQSLSQSISNTVSRSRSSPRGPDMERGTVRSGRGGLRESPVEEMELGVRVNVRVEVERDHDHGNKDAGVRSPPGVAW